MHKENLFNLIRKEDVVIWAGAGLSYYAGFPSGKKLGEIMLASLSEQERNQIDSTLLLTDLAEEIFRIKGNNKNALIRVLNKTFLDHIPSATACHDKIALIPHIRTIITTNYDKMIENSFGQKCQIIYSPKHIAYLERNKIHIFKVHGDLSEPDSIIITKSDYNNFFRNSSENDIYWTVVKERLASKSVLFLGYNLEDPNVSVIFDKITDELKTHRKECFLVAPNLVKHKAQDLIKKGIHYIDSTAEELIDDLISDLKENVIDDLEKGKTSADVFREFLSNFNLLPELKTNVDTYKLLAINSTDENINGNLNFTLKNDKEFIKEFNEFISGKKIGEFEIADDKLLKVDLSYGGIKFPKGEGLGKLVFKTTPKKSAIIDIRFDDDFELFDIPIKLYGNPEFIEIHVELNSAVLKIKLDIDNRPDIKVNFHYKHHLNCPRIKDEIELFKLLQRLASGMHFLVFSESKEILSKTFPVTPSILMDSEYLLKYFENLKLIEQHYNLKFVNIPIDSITETMFNLVFNTVLVIKEKPIILDWEGELEMDLFDHTEQTLEKVKSVNEKNSPITALYRELEEIEIHGHKIKLGYKKVEYLEVYITNLDQILQGKEITAKFKSRTKKLKMTFTENIESEEPSP